MLYCFANVIIAVFPAIKAFDAVLKHSKNISVDYAYRANPLKVQPSMPYFYGICRHSVLIDSVYLSSIVLAQSRPHVKRRR